MGCLSRGIQSSIWIQNSGVEHDLHELLNVFATTWEEELQEVKKRLLSSSLWQFNEVCYVVRVEAKLRAPCFGLTATELRCCQSSCGFKIGRDLLVKQVYNSAFQKLRYDTFGVISLTIPKMFMGLSVTIEALLRKYFCMEVIRGATCDRCKSRTGKRDSGLFKKQGFSKHRIELYLHTIFVFARHQRISDGGNIGCCWRTESNRFGIGNRSCSWMADRRRRQAVEQQQLEGTSYCSSAGRLAGKTPLADFAECTETRSWTHTEAGIERSERCSTGARPVRLESSANCRRIGTAGTALVIGWGRTETGIVVRRTAVAVGSVAERQHRSCRMLACKPECIEVVLVPEPLAEQHHSSASIASCRSRSIERLVVAERHTTIGIGSGTVAYRLPERQALAGTAAAAGHRRCSSTAIGIGRHTERLAAAERRTTSGIRSDTAACRQRERRWQAGTAECRMADKLADRLVRTGC
ncbi:hypothetical protein OSTOST_15726 [Ostertagia ostertagi]